LDVREGDQAEGQEGVVWELRFALSLWVSLWLAKAKGIERKSGGCDGVVKASERRMRCGKESDVGCDEEMASETA